MQDKTRRRNRLEESPLVGALDYKQLVQSTSAIILRIDLEGRITFINDHAQKFFGYSADEIVGRHAVGTIIPEKDSTGRNLTAMVDQIIAEPDRFHTNTNENIKKSGERVWLEWTNSGIFDVNGKLREFLSVGIDVTERKRAEQALFESERRLQFVLNNSIDAAYQRNLQQDTYVYMSPVIEDILGYSSEEMTSFKMDTLTALMHPDDLPLVQQEIELTSHGERRTGVIEYRFLTKNGEYRWLADRFNLIRSDAGDPLYRVGMVRDITDRKRIEDALIASRMELQNVINGASSIIYAFDLDGKCIFANKALADLFGSSPEGLIGRTRYDFMPGETAKWHEANDRKVIEEGHKLDFEEYGPIRKDGRPIAWLTTKFPLRDHLGKIYASAGISTNITDRKQMEEEIRRSRDELELRVQHRTTELASAYDTLKKEIQERGKIEEKLRQSHKMEAIGTFAGGIAHDFNNILAAILGFTEMAIEDSSDHPLIERSLKNIHTSAIRARDLVKQILAFSRKASYDRVPVSLSESIRETIKLLRASISKTIEINLNINATSDIILASATEIQQIVMNLASNAAIAMEEKGGILEITLADADEMSDSVFTTESSSNDYMQLIVKDTGTGIERDVVNRIFDPFFTTRSPGSGTGMGLAVVYGIVNDLQGTIMVESMPGIGSTFRVFLPKVNTDIDRKKVKTSQIPTGTESILFIDDEDLLAEWAKITLERLGYRVTVTTDPAEALEKFTLGPSTFDLVITDQSMPTMSGMRLAEKILAIRPDIPIILGTGHSAVVTPKIAKKAGIKEFVMKPIARPELARIVRKTLDKNKKE